MDAAIAGEDYLPFLNGQGFLDIALQSIRRDQIFDQGAGLLQYVENKNQLRRQSQEGAPLVFAMQPDSITSQRELAEFERRCSRKKPLSKAQAKGASLSLASESAPSNDLEPLWSTSLRVKEDLCILQHINNSYCLTAASLCAPSGWSLQERLGQPIEQLHAPVPDLNARRAIQINRLLDNLKEDRFYRRFNWSLKQHDNLADFPAAGGESVDPKWISSQDSIFLRVERQTLFKLPKTQSIVFCILVSVVSLESLFSRHPCQEQLKAALLALSPEQKSYKGINEISKYLIESL